MRSLALALALGACCALPRAAALAAPAQAGPSLLVVGDSMALGTGADTPAGGFAFQTFRKVRAADPGARIRSVAIGGATVADALRLEMPRLGPLRGDVVIVEIGSNDVVRRTPAPAFAARFRALLARVRRVEPRAGLVVVGIPDVAISPLFAGGDRAAIHRAALADARAVRAAAASAGARYVDLFAISDRLSKDTGRYLSADQFHPSTDGYTIIADAVYPAVAAALRQPRS
jgi:lysophospholipase L1-like esterase